MSNGQQFSFIIEKDIVKRMDRVVRMNDGRVLHKRQQDGDVVYTVERT
jgi:hypothetical protein